MKTELEGKDLLLWRRGHKMGQEELARHLGVTRKTIGNWERGQSRLPASLAADLERLATTLAQSTRPPPEKPQEMMSQGRRYRWSVDRENTWTNAPAYWAPPREWTRQGGSLEAWKALDEATKSEWRVQQHAIDED